MNAYTQLCDNRNNLKFSHAERDSLLVKKCYKKYYSKRRTH